MGGNLLNCQELTGLQVGLTELRNAEKCLDIYFWGKIFGTKSDYYIAYCLHDSAFEFSMKKFFFATETYEFKPLPAITAEVGEQLMDSPILAPFQGDADAPAVPPEPGQADSS